MAMLFGQRGGGAPTHPRPEKISRTIVEPSHSDRQASSDGLSAAAFSSTAIASGHAPLFIKFGRYEIVDVVPGRRGQGARLGDRRIDTGQLTSTGSARPSGMSLRIARYGLLQHPARLGKIFRA